MGAVVGTRPLAAPSLQGVESAVPESGAALGLPGDAPDLPVGFPQPSPALPTDLGRGTGISGCRGKHLY